MSKKKKESRNILLRAFDVVTGNIPTTDFINQGLAPKEKIYSEDQRDSLLKAMKEMQTDRRPTTQTLPYVNTVTKKNMIDTVENERLLQMFPEIPHSASIMIASILSPNDMRVGELQIECEMSEFTPDKNAAIGQYLTKFFEEKFNFSSTLSQWLYDALYVKGAKPLVLIPIPVLIGEIDNPNYYKKSVGNESVSVSFDSHGISNNSPNNFSSFMNKIATENLETLLEKESKKSLFGFSNSQTENKEKFYASIENMANDYLSQVNKGLKKNQKIELKKPSENNPFRSLIDEMVSQEALTILDNPAALGIPKLKNEAKKLKNKRTIREYLPQPFYGLPDTDVTDMSNIGENPLFLEIPFESIVPIYTPGSPSDHIGYFVMLDEFGHPVVDPSTQNDMWGDANEGEYTANGNNRAMRISALFNSYGFDRNNEFDNVPVRRCMEDIYQTVIEYHLNAACMKAGTASVALGSNAALYRAMFTRFLQVKKTKILYLPVEYVTYLAFKHSKYGVGVSKLDEMKYILSLDGSLTISRMTAAFNNAIDKKLITLTPGPNHVGNIQQMVDMISQQYIAKNIWNFSSNPNYTSMRIAEQAISVQPRGVPGLPDFTIEKENDNRAPAQFPDPELAEKIQKEKILGLGVPAAAMNETGDNEYSRGVVTTNILFARDVSIKQKAVVRHMNSFIRTYCLFSKEINDKLLSLIGENKKSDNGSEMNVSENTREKILEIIESVTIKLPDPNVAPDQAQINNISQLTSGIGQVIDMLHDDGLGLGDQLLTAYNGFMKSVKKNIVGKALANELGIPQALIDAMTTEPTNSQCQEALQKLMNVGAGASAAYKLFQPLITPPQQGDNTGMDPSMGGPDMSGGVPPDTAGDSDGFGDTSNSPPDTSSTNDAPQNT